MKRRRGQEIARERERESEKVKIDYKKCIVKKKETMKYRRNITRKNTFI